ncbi:MAG: hypothetical protein R3195_08195 [Gemmatimonadota bacterium]|nr:hypothetical protein [Gemmatimonadota bacterium]
MFLELAEILDCPVCRDGYGLVAFVRGAERRRVLSGRLGCPICEVEFPITDGVIDFGHAGEAGSETPEAHIDDPERSRVDPELPVRLAALLGLGDREGLAVLLGAGLGGAGVAVARLGGRVEVVSVSPSAAACDAWTVDDLSQGVDPVVGFGSRWPIRSGALDGVALLAGSRADRDEAVRCLVPGGRLVVIEPADGWEDGLAAGVLDPVAADAATWVGVRK